VGSLASAELSHIFCERDLRVRARDLIEGRIEGLWVD
jgi:hypothetical protein